MLNRLQHMVYSVKSGIKTDFTKLRNNAAARRIYKYFRCPGCKSKLRVSRGKGKIYITCPRCGLRFTGRS